MKAFVLVNLQEKQERDIADHLEELDRVINAHILFGEWDLIAEVEIENSEDLASFVMDEIRSLSEVKLTSSMIVAE